MIRKNLPLLTASLCITMLAVSTSSSAFAQNNSAALVENAIKMLKSSGAPVEATTMAQMYSSAAQLHLNDGNQEQAVARITQALDMCRDQNLDAATPLALIVAALVMKKMDTDLAAEFLQSQLNHPNASDTYKKEVQKALGQQLARSGSLVKSIQMSGAAVDSVRKEAPGTIEEAEALLAHGQNCMTAKLFDLGLPPLKEARVLGAKLNRPDISDRAAFQFAMGLVRVDKDKEARDVLVDQIQSIRNSGNLLMLPTMQMALARLQIKLGNFDTATQTIETLASESSAASGQHVSFAKSLSAAHVFAKAVRQGTIEQDVRNAIQLLEEAIVEKTAMFGAAGKTITEAANAEDLLSLAAFQAIALDDEAATKTLDRVRLAITAREKQYQQMVDAGAMESDETQVIIADQRAAIAQLRQLLLVRAGKTEEALVVAERFRGAAQAEILQRKLSVGKKDRNKDEVTIERIQSIADSQNTTLVYYSLVHALDPTTRGYFDSDHTINSPQSLYIWVVRPKEKIKFRSTILPVRVDDLVAKARKEIFAFMSDAESEQAVQDDEGSLATDVDVVRMLMRSADVVTEPSQGGDALRRLHQILIEPIVSLLPKDPDEIVTIVPQGALYTVPFAALIDDKDEPLIAAHTLSMSPSAQMLALAAQQFQSVKLKNNTEVLIVGNPAMPSYQSRPDKPAVRLQPLPGAESEADYIADLFKVTALKGEAADEKTVVAAMKSAKYIHLATHGLLEAENTYAQSYLSSLAFAPGEGADGFLTVRETMQLDLNAELAVLSGCDTGRGRITGDGVIGLARGYISSGVPTVVVSLWPVSDNSTALLMVMYYKGLISGRSKASALRDAMLKTRAQFEQPHAWAAFALYGYSQ